MAGSTRLMNPVPFDLQSEQANEMFLKPVFVSDNILMSNYIRVMRNVKRESVMYYAGPLSRIVQKNDGCGWTPQGKMAITQRKLEVCREKVQLSFCTDEFFDTCFEYALGQEIDIYQLDDTETGRVILGAWMDRISEGVLNDIFELGFFGDTDSVIPFFAQCDGWFKIIEADIAAGETPATVATGSGAPLPAGQSVTIFDDIMDAQLPVLDKLAENEKVFLVSNTVWKNYRKFLKDNPNVESSWQALQDGVVNLFYCGIPVVRCCQFDEVDTEMGNPLTHRVVLTYRQNLTVGTDIRGEETQFTVRFEEREKTHEIDAYFKLGFNVAHPELVVYGK